MKTYIVYVDGTKAGMLKASGHNAAEKKAYAKFKDQLTQRTDRLLGTQPTEAEIRSRISVSYTEI